MKIARVVFDDRVFLGRVDDDGVALLVEESGRPGADAFREAIAADVDFSGGFETVPTAEYRLLAPIVNPSKFLCIGLNYLEHGAEQDVEVPEKPLIFAKTINTIVGPHDAVRFRGSLTSQVDYEAELGVVIGRRLSRASRAEATNAVFGYTVINDVSARDAQFEDGQWTRGKSFDTFGPVGPWIITSDDIPDPQSLRISCRVSKETLQDSNTALMMRGVIDIIVYISQFITLEPGDLIATGTPGGVGFARTPPRYLQDGDVLETTIAKIGNLTNSIQVLDD
jgi:2-keto-4-pentenoate hydratase/2-oxohepta-3-ene-1,7-dioic acid hydratase in catechol pathway